MFTFLLSIHLFFHSLFWNFEVGFFHVTLLTWYLDQSGFKLVIVLLFQSPLCLDCRCDRPCLTFFFLFYVFLWQEMIAMLHPQSGNREWWLLILSSLSPFYSVSIPNQWNCNTHTVRMGLSLSIKQSLKTLINTSRSVFPW